MNRQDIIEWISVKDLLPQDETKVFLVFLGELCIGFYFEDSHWNVYGYASHEYKRVEIDQVEFWAKLPEWDGRGIDYNRRVDGN